MARHSRLKMSCALRARCPTRRSRSSSRRRRATVWRLRARSSSARSWLAMPSMESTLALAAFPECASNTRALANCSATSSAPMRRAWANLCRAKSRARSCWCWRRASRAARRAFASKRWSASSASSTTMLIPRFPRAARSVRRAISRPWRTPRSYCWAKATSGQTAASNPPRGLSAAPDMNRWNCKRKKVWRFSTART